MNDKSYWGLGIGDWGLGIGANPQSPIPNPQLFIFISNANNNYMQLYAIIYNYLNINTIQLIIL